MPDSTTGNPNLPEQQPLTETGTREDDERKIEKQRRTRIKRIYGVGASESGESGNKDNEHYWVDVEVVDNATNDGRQWPDRYGVRGNAALDTIMGVDNDRDRSGRTKEDVDVGMNPDDPEKGPFVRLKATEVMEFQTSGGARVKRYFYNGRDNTTRVSVGRRIQCNNIDDEYMHDDPEAADKSEQRLPPTDPKKYKEAVEKTDDPQNVFLQIYVPLTFKTNRGQTTQFQTNHYVRLWGDEPFINLPGEEATAKDREKDAEYIMLDPYQTIVNFGPDSLAVKFHAGAGPENKK